MIIWWKIWNLIRNRALTQPANIDRQVVSRTHTEVPRTSPADPIWPSRGRPELKSQGRPDLTSWGRLQMTSRGHPNLTSKRHSWEVSSGPWKHILDTMWGHLLDVLNFFLLFFRNLFDWPNLYKSNSTIHAYLEPVNYFRERTSP